MKARPTFAGACPPLASPRAPPMYLSSNQSRALGQAMHLMAEADDADTLREALGIPLLDLLGADTYVSMVWDPATERFERPAAQNMPACQLRAWDEYYRFVDPLTFAMMKRRRPTVATQVLAQNDLNRTEFFNDFLQVERLHWGINIYFFSEERCLGDFRIWRRRERGNFDAAEIEVLRMLEPSLTATLDRLNSGQAPKPRFESVPDAPALLRQHARLSPREADVAWLVACGCPDKQIAQRLNVGLPTVRFHLANIFRKLRADNRASVAARVQTLVESRHHAGLSA